MTEFFIWSHNLTPQLEEHLSFHDVVDLGVFAHRYDIPALSNQVTDRIRAKLADADWHLEATVVDTIYQAAPATSHLREVIKAALGQLPRTSIDGEEWEQTFKKNPELGWDLHKASGKEWAKQDYLSGQCRFHNHDGIKRQEGLCDGCPYAENDCYPIWDEDTKNAHESGPNLEAEHPSALEEQSSDPVIKDTVATEPAPDTPGDAVKITHAPNGAHTNGHIEATEEPQDAAEDIVEHVNGAETPHINGYRGAVTATADELRSESGYGGDTATDLPESSSDRENNPVTPGPEMQQTIEAGGEKDQVAVITTATPPGRLSKNAKKKARRMSKSQANPPRA